jgi:mono/diheme cytochrome c family protein
VSRRLPFGIGLALALVVALSAQSPRLSVRFPSQREAEVKRGADLSAVARSAKVEAPPPQTFNKYCLECHSTAKKRGGLDLESLLQKTTLEGVGEGWEDWELVAEAVETGVMPPEDATDLPTDEEREASAAWVRGTLAAYEARYAGQPGPVTVRRLTSAEYKYAIEDLTGVAMKVGIDASSDSVGGEGFANFGDVQFVQDATIERYLEAARAVADHAVIGAGPVGFFHDPGDTGLELSALHRINSLYARHGFRVVSGEGGRPFGFDRYSKAFYVAWEYRHRERLGQPTATLRALASREGITPRFAEHIWSALQTPSPGYPLRLTVDAWKQLPPPTSRSDDSRAAAQKACDDIVKALVTWPSWLFARGDLAAGGAGDESPLVFDDTTLTASASHAFSHHVGPRFVRFRPVTTPGPWRVSVAVDSLTPDAGPAVIIWKNPRIVTRAVMPPDPVIGAAARRRPVGPILESRPLRDVVSADTARDLAFGASRDGSPVGPEDFATSSSFTFQIEPAPEGQVYEFHADAALGSNRNAVARVVITDAPGGPAREAGNLVFIGDPGSPGYRKYRADIAQYVALMPPNSHGEANPADKDPVPAPFDNTYNSPEHDAFVVKVKYQRTDDFFTRNVVEGEDRAALDAAWNDLFGSWPYHDAYLGMLADHYRLTLPTTRVAELTPAILASLAPEPRKYVTSLKRHFDEVQKALSAAQSRHVGDVLAFAGRAWRRPLTARESEGLRGFYQTQRLVNKLEHDDAVRALIARVLVSPAFLYRFEPPAERTERALDGWELASRLSFFLWSSIPDDELRRAAAAGELTTEASLAAQVRRMAADPKARRLATEFFGQWLGFYHFDEYRGVDTGRFPEFTDEVRASMYDEAISTFEYIVRERRPVSEILHADYAFLNKTLATFYGVNREVPEGRVSLVKETGALDRGGALRLGSVLTVTSAPLRTSPVKRGNWILRQVLGTPTPPPPADAGNIPADDKVFGGLTLRQRLEEHKRNATCAACHVRIDPLGFPLESFDAVGRVRATYADGTPVDVIGELRNRTTIRGAGGLLDYLRSQDRKVMTTLSRKMLGYSLGRTPMASDRPLLDTMIRSGRTSSFADLATRIVTSRQFRYRGAETPSTAPALVSSHEARLR